MKLTEEQQRALENAKWRAKVRWNNAVNWCIGHADVLIPALAITIPVVGKISHDIHRDRIERYKDEHRRLEMYDPVIGGYIKLRRELTPAEKVTVTQRRRQGETVSEILYDLRLTK